MFRLIRKVGEFYSIKALLSFMLLVPILSLLLCLSSTVTANYVHAATFNPTTTQELIDAINISNSNGESDVINLVPGMIYTITGAETGVPFSDGNGDNGLPVILPDSGSSILINGDGNFIERDPALFSNDSTNPCSGPGINFRLLQIDSGADLTLDKLTLQNGCEVLGGAIWNSGTVTIPSATISNNRATNDGGAIFNNGRITMVNNTLSGNESADDGGGLFNNGGSVFITNSTIADNTAVGSGGGIFVSNTAGVDLKNSLIVSNSGDNCSLQAGGSINDLGGNISDDGADDCSFAFNAGFISATMLGPLQDNGGSILTHSLIEPVLTTNPAIDAVVDCTDQSASPIDHDERGVPRIFGIGCDIGAYEFLMSPPMLVEAQKLVASDAAAGDNMGWSVSLYGDRAILGARADNGTTGAAYIFERDLMGNWNEAAKLTADDGVSGDAFGTSVAIEGDTVFVGAVGNDQAGSENGAVYVFERDMGGNWTQVQKLLPSLPTNGDSFGVNVSINNDYAVIGAYLSDADPVFGPLNSGSIYIYERSGGSWSELQKIDNPDPEDNDGFGFDVDIEGDTILVGVITDDTSPPARINDGSAYVYDRDAMSGLWLETQQLTASDGASLDEFGVRVSLSGDWAVIGAYQEEDPGGNNTGAAYTFQRVAGVWSETQKLTASDREDFDFFGFSLSISGDTLVVGDREDTTLPDSAGLVHVFKRDSSDTWNQVQKLIAGDSDEDDIFGYKISLDGNRVLIGARGDSPGQPPITFAGAGYIFETGSKLFIAKQTTPINGTGFEFLGTGFPSNCGLDRTFFLDDFTFDFCSLLPLTYTVQETNSQGHALTNIECFSSQSYSTNADSVTIDLFESEVALCLFTNEQFALNVTLSGTGSGMVTSSPSGIDCETDCSEFYPANEVVTLTASPDGISEFVQWTGDCSGITTDVDITIDGSKTCDAEFALQQRTLTLNKAGNGTGTVTSTPAGIECNDACNSDSSDFDINSMVTLNAVESPDSTFVGFSGDAGCNTGTVTMDVAKTCIATFTLMQRTLTLNKAGNGTGTVTSTPAGIDCNDACNSDSSDFDINSMVTLTAAQGTNSLFTVWGGDCSAAGNNPMATVTMSEARTCTATFVLEERTLTLNKAGNGVGTVTSAPAGIDCNEGCNSDTGDFDINGMVTLNAVESPGSNFTGWGGDCSAAGNDPMATVTMSEARTCTATFVLEQRTLTLNKAGSGAGTVTSAPVGIDCNDACNSDSSDFDINTMVTLNAVESPGSNFTGWGGDCSVAGDDPMATVTMSDARTCVAIFDINVFTLNITLAGDGSGNVSAPGIDCGNGGIDCSEMYTLGTMVSLMATPDGLSDFIEFTGDPDCVDGEITINGPITCIAIFDSLNPIVLNPLSPAIDDNINTLTAEEATPGGPVAFLWGLFPGTTVVNGQVCRGLELGIKNPSILAIATANQLGVATHIFYIPTFNDLEFEVQLQAVDVDTCRASEVIAQVIRKDESG